MPGATSPASTSQPHGSRDGLLRRGGRARATSTSAISRPARSASSPTRSTRRSTPRTWSRRRWCASSPSTASRSPASSTSRSGASPAPRCPALVSVHGGPGGQSRVGYSALIQYLVNHGYAVYAINNRGSSGYGKTFYAMDDRKHGEADLDDCVASKKMLAATG